MTPPFPPGLPALMSDAARLVRESNLDADPPCCRGSRAVPEPPSSGDRGAWLRWADAVAVSGPPYLSGFLSGIADLVRPLDDGTFLAAWQEHVVAAVMGA